MKILAVGDVVGNGGTEFIRRNLWNIRKANEIDFAVVNGENAAKGNGLDIFSAETLLASGADVITGGNHIWQKHEIKDFIENNDYVLRPANYPSACPGRGCYIYNVQGKKVLVMSLLGNVYMNDSLESPFETADRLLKRHEGEYDICIIDLHAEATAEKIAFAKYFDSRASVVFGTHTHVQTNDAKVLPGGTGFVTDVGMTGAYDSVLGVKNECVLEKFLYKMPVRFEQAQGKIMFNAAIFDIDQNTNLCNGCRLLNFCEE